MKVLDQIAVGSFKLVSGAREFDSCHFYLIFK